MTPPSTPKDLFFTPADLALLQAEAGTPYDSTSRREQERLARLQLAVGAKTKLWVAHLRVPGYTHQYRLNLLKSAGTVATPGGLKRRLVIQSFTWTSLLRPIHRNHGIFFTVGVAADRDEPALMVKLDCKRAGVGALDPRLVARFDAYVAEHGPRPLVIPAAELPDWDWPRLAAATQRYLADHEANYRGAIHHVWQDQEPGRNKLARICWNTDGWQCPSGPLGKSSAAGAYEGGDGSDYGVEEWLFDFSRLRDGYHYAFLQPVNAAGTAAMGKRFNIRLYSINGQTKEAYYVGRIYNAEVLAAEQRAEAFAYYEDRGWLAQMTAEIRAIGGTGDLTDEENGFAPFNIRFRPGDVERPSTENGLVLIPDLKEWTRNYHYMLLNDHAPEVDAEDPERAGDDEDDEAPEPFLDLDGAADARATTARHRQTAARALELPALHEQLQARLVERLQREFPGDRIELEVPVRHTRRWMDVVRRRPDGHTTLYEVKALPTLKGCLREALGQLLEYACWPDRRLADEWVIVSHFARTPAVETYLGHLRAQFSLPVSYETVALG